MSLVLETFLEHEYEGKVVWIPYSKISNVESTQIDNVYFAFRKEFGTSLMLLFLGSEQTCTPTFVSEFARIYSLPTQKYSADVGHFKRYTKWLRERNNMIEGFTKHGDKYYMVANRRFYHCYSRYGFCSACGILRCSPVWCVCGHKQLSDGWTSNNKFLDEFIKKSQWRTNSANEAYLEWIPSEFMGGEIRLPTTFTDTYPPMKFIPLEITDRTNNSYYDKLCVKYPDILVNNVWATIGFTYDTKKRKYYLIKDYYKEGLCLGCTIPIAFNSRISAFCYICKAPRPVDWTTGNKSLDLFIMESWSNMARKDNAYVQWIEYALLLKNVQEMSFLHHGCTHIAECYNKTTNKWTNVSLKQIVDGQNAQSFDFYQLTKEYPGILTPDNIWVIGITQSPTTQEYYLVFYHKVDTIIDKIMQDYPSIKYMQFADFHNIEEIRSGPYETVYTAQCKGHLQTRLPESVVLKCFKSYDEVPELFITELRNHANCLGSHYNDKWYFPGIYGVIQNPETKEYGIVMDYANCGSLLSYLEKNFNKLTWRMKLQYLEDIAHCLHTIHNAATVHCDLHGGNIVMNYKQFQQEEEYHMLANTEAYICNFGHSKSVNSHGSKSTIQGILPFTAPEVFHTCKFTKKSDVYSFGMVMYLMATGELPFSNRLFDKDLLCDIVSGLRPLMPDSIPEEYKKLAEMCWDADPDKRPDMNRLKDFIHNALCDRSDIWETIYCDNIRPLSHLEVNKSVLLIGELSKPENKNML